MSTLDRWLWGQCSGGSWDLRRKERCGGLPEQCKSRELIDRSPRLSLYQPVCLSLSWSLFFGGIPFIHHFAVVPSKVEVLVRADVREIAESLEIGSAIQVELIKRQDKSETLPAGSLSCPTESRKRIKSRRGNGLLDVCCGRRNSVPKTGRQRISRVPF
jgi:hypothetical protein